MDLIGGPFIADFERSGTVNGIWDITGILLLLDLLIINGLKLS